MIASYMIGARFQGYQQFKKKLPSVFQIQDLIEAAWDAGINTQGRVETGGIKGTRKYIGTPEVSSHRDNPVRRIDQDNRLFYAGSCYASPPRSTVSYPRSPEFLRTWKPLTCRLHETSCDAQGFKDKEPGKSEALLIDHIENYFMSGVIDPGQRVRATNLPPIYFQHAGMFSHGRNILPVSLFKKKSLT